MTDGATISHTQAARETERGAVRAATELFIGEQAQERARERARARVHSHFDGMKQSRGLRASQTQPRFLC